MPVVTASAVRSGPQQLKSLLRTPTDAGNRPKPALQATGRRAPLSLLAGGLLVALALCAAVAAPLIAPYAPEQVRAGPRLAPPSAAHLFGTDALGRDGFSRVLFGATIAAQAAIAGMGIAALLGIPAGLLAGYRGGWLDRALSRGVDVWLAFPGLLLALVVVARLGPSLSNAIIAVGLLGAPGFFRLTRSLALSTRRMAYVEAAEAVGCSEGRVLLRHILPNLASSLIVFATMRAGTAILAVGGLSFVGLGAQLPSPEWGALLAAGRSHMDTAPWLAIYPGLSLTLTVVGLNLLGDGLRDLWDGGRCPKKRYA
ncbi:MAG: ABC transporter permease [Chloroflexi bacterium]|nr:ABC transporter permease [Chloroflexota bacterium]